MEEVNVPSSQQNLFEKCLSLATSLLKFNMSLEQ